MTAASRSATRLCNGQVTISQAHRQLPNMPTEVFSQWLAPLIATYGLPFLPGQQVATPPWDRLLLRKPLRYWASLLWHLETVPYGQVALHRAACEKARLILLEVNGGGKAFVTDIERMHDRFWACADFIGKHGRFPVPVICCADTESIVWNVADGHHRLAALFQIRDADEFPFHAWVGIPPH